MRNDGSGKVVWLPVGSCKFILVFAREQDGANAAVPFGDYPQGWKLTIELVD